MKKFELKPFSPGQKATAFILIKWQYLKGNARHGSRFSAREAFV